MFIQKQVKFNIRELYGNSQLHTIKCE